jgi:hypothetical protein
LQEHRGHLKAIVPRSRGLKECDPDIIDILPTAAIDMIAATIIPLHKHDRPAKARSVPFLAGCSQCWKAAEEQ